MGAKVKVAYFAIQTSFFPPPVIHSIYQNHELKFWPNTLQERSQYHRLCRDYGRIISSLPPTEMKRVFWEEGVVSYAIVVM